MSKIIHSIVLDVDDALKLTDGKVEHMKPFILVSLRGYWVRVSASQRQKRLILASLVTQGKKEICPSLRPLPAIMITTPQNTNRVNVMYCSTVNML